MHVAISSFPRAVHVTFVNGLAFLPRGSVLTVIILRLLPLQYELQYVIFRFINI
jgi:hypothetical protein